MIQPIDNGTEALIRYRKSHWDFLSRAVRTLDQADRLNPIKPFPSEKEYLHPIADFIVSDPLVAIVKHRRMVITWLACAIALWDAMFHEGRHVAIVSKKEEDSDELVQRCNFIYQNIPTDVLRIKPTGTYKYTSLSFPEIDSRIKAYAQGPDQLRQFTCSRVFCDEIAFWPQARQTFVSLKPTIQGGGQVCLISTRFPGFFKDVIEDVLDHAA